MLNKTGGLNLGSMLAHANAVSNQLLEIEIGQIISDPQVRTVFSEESIRELADSFIIEGQQTPIIVSPMREGQYTIQKGERRWRAAKVAGLTHVKAIINDPAENAIDAIAGQLIENIQREDLTPMEVAVAAGKLRDAGLNNNQIADRLGKSAPYVSKHLGLLSLPALALELYNESVITDVESLNYLRQMYDADEDTFELFCNQAKERGSANRADCREAFNEAKRAKIAKEQGYIPSEDNPNEQLYDVPAGKVIQFDRAEPENLGHEQRSDSGELEAEEQASASATEMSNQNEATSSETEPTHAPVVEAAHKAKPAAEKPAKATQQASETEGVVEEQSAVSSVEVEAVAGQPSMVISCEIDMDGEKVRATLALDQICNKEGHAVLYADIGEIHIPFEEVRIIGMEFKS